MERQEQLRKENPETNRAARSNSLDSLRSPVSIRSPTLGNVPEESSAFAIGDDESDEEGEVTGLIRSHTASSAVTVLDSPRPASVASTDEALPIQLRGMSEKARGKMPAGSNSFSRQNSINSMHNLISTTSYPGNFQPTAEWVSYSLISISLSDINTRLRVGNLNYLFIQHSPS
jgi:hypothetical protein